MKKAIIVMIVSSFLSPLYAAEEAAHPDTSGKGWEELFNGKDLTGLMNAGGRKYDGKTSSKDDGTGWIVKDKALVLKGKGGNIWTQKRYGDFILDLELQTHGNSGLLFRTDNPRSYVQTGFEMQVERRGKPGNKHSFGALYDCQAPAVEVRGDKEWHRVTLTCKDNIIRIVIDKKLVNEVDLNKWTTPRKNPDGSKNKFKTAIKDFKREGHIGFQDHGRPVMYRNIKIKPLKKEEKK